MYDNREFSTQNLTYISVNNSAREVNVIKETFSLFLFALSRYLNDFLSVILNYNKKKKVYK